MWHRPGRSGFSCSRSTSSRRPAAAEAPPLPQWSPKRAHSRAPAGGFVSWWQEGAIDDG